MADATGMKLGIIADIHGNHVALEAVLTAVYQEAEHVAFLGDLCGYYPFVNECVALWDATRIIGVRGNHDQVLLDCLDRGVPPPPAYQARYGSALERSRQRLQPEAERLLRSWPPIRAVRLARRSLLLCHGAPWDPLEGRVYPDETDWTRFGTVDAEIILLGHTHYPLAKRAAGRLVINPGSVGQPRDRRPGASYAVLDLDTVAVAHRRVAYAPESLIDDAKRHDPDVPYLVEALTR